MKNVVLNVLWEKGAELHNICCLSLIFTLKQGCLCGMIGRLVAGMVGRLVAGMIGRLVGGMIGLLVAGMVGRLVGGRCDGMVGCFVVRRVNWGLRWNGGLWCSWFCPDEKEGICPSTNIVTKAEKTHGVYNVLHVLKCP